MRVLTLVDHLGLGGTQRAAVNYSRAYRRLGHDVAVLAYLDSGLRRRELEGDGIEVFQGARGPEAKARALALAEGWNPEVVHVHRKNPEDCPLANPLRTLRRPGRFVLETSVFSRFDPGPDRDLIDLHLHLSTWGLWKWRQWAGRSRPKPRGLVLPYLVETDTFRPAAASERETFRRQYGVPSEAFLVGRVGQPIASKWSPALIEAFERLAATDAGAWLLAAGMPADLAAELERLPRRALARVRRLPVLETDAALRACYSALDLFVHAARIGESFGMVLGEAMACECPVVTLSTPAKDNAQLEVVGHGEGGLVASRPRDLAPAVLGLRTDPDLRRRLGRGGRRRVVERFGRAAVERKLDKLLKAIAADPAPERVYIALSEDPDFAAEVRDVPQLRHRALGSPWLGQELLMRLVHVPAVYFAYRAAVRSSRPVRERLGRLLSGAR